MIMESPTEKLIIVVDIGSSSVRCSCIGQEIIFFAQTPSFLSDKGLAGANDVFAVVNQCISSCLDGASKLLGPSQVNVSAICFTGFAMSLVGLDAQYDPCTPVITYANNIYIENCQPDISRFHNETGCMIHSSYATMSVRSFLRHQDQGSLLPVCWQSLSSFIISKWTNRRVAMSYCDASWSGLLDWRNGTWHEDAVKWTFGDCNDMLPDLADFDDLNGVELSSEYSSKWPPLAHSRIFLGVADGACATIGSGAYLCDNLLTISVTIGTSSAARIMLRDWSNIESIPLGLWCYRVTRDMVVIGGALNDGGCSIEWFNRVVNDEAEIIVMQPLQSWPIFLPYLRGERSLNWRDGVRGSIHNLSISSSRDEIRYCILEGICLQLREIISLICSCFPSRRVVMIGSGGFLEKSPTHCQILSNILQLPLFMSSSSEVTSKGVAMLVTRNLSASGSSYHVEYHPNEEWKQVISFRLNLQKEIINKLS